MCILYLMCLFDLSVWGNIATPTPLLCSNTPTVHRVTQVINNSLTNFAGSSVFINNPEAYGYIHHLNTPSRHIMRIYSVTMRSKYSRKHVHQQMNTASTLSKKEGKRYVYTCNPYQILWNIPCVRTWVRLSPNIIVDTCHKVTPLWTSRIRTVYTDYCTHDQQLVVIWFGLNLSIGFT